MSRSLALWTGVLAGPIVWAVSFVAKVFIGGWVCVYPWKPALFAITFASMIGAAAAGLLSWRQWQQLGREYPGDGGDVISRGRGMALAGVALNAGFLVVLVAQALPDLMLRGCE